MLDILFVTPSFSPKLQEESIGTLILAKIAMAANYEVHVLRYWEAYNDFTDYSLFKKYLINRIISYKAKIVSFYCRCTDYHISIDIANSLKALNNELIIVFGGPQAELVASETLENFNSIDYICCSEGETTIVPFLNYLLRNREAQITPDSIPGLVYRDQNNICQNPFPTLLPNGYCSIENYYDIIPSEVLNNSYRATIDVGRGCPFCCTFCSTKSFWKRKFRLRNIKNIVDEIEFVVHNIGITRFDLDHDLFTADKKKVVEFCEELKARKLNISWHCSSRIDTIDKELVDIMIECGLFKIMFGIESASLRMQKIIRKNLNLNDCFDIVAYCRNKGLRVITSFIYGLPEDSEEDFEQSFRMMQKFQNMGANVSTYLCGILNGTELYQKYHDKLVFSEENVKNHKYFGLEDLEDIIVKHPTIFPHFYDLDIPLRMSLRYFEVFRNIWNLLFPNTFGFVSNIFIRANMRYLDMYYMFIESNNIQIKHSYFEDKLFGLTKRQCKEISKNFIITLKELVIKNQMSNNEYQTTLKMFMSECQNNISDANEYE